MAYLRSLVVKCSRCLRPATVELLNNRNAVIGQYCKRCGAVALAESKRREAAAGEWSG